MTMATKLDRKAMRAGAGCAALAVLGALLIAWASGPGKAPAHAAERPATAEPKPAAEAKPAPGTVVLTEGQLQQVKVAPVAAEKFRAQLNAIGRIAFNEDATTPVFPPYSGRITRVIAKIGDRVDRGSPLFVIETPDVIQAQTDMYAAQAAAAKARNQLDLARRAAARQSDLYKDKAVAQKDFEQSQTELRNAESEARSSSGAEAAARDKLRVLGKSEGAKGEVGTVTVRAPLAGTVIGRKIGPGQWVKTDAADPLLTIADLTTMVLLADIPESDIAAIRPGQPVEVRVMAYPDDLFRAQITTVGAAVDPATHRISVRSTVANPDGRLKPEMFATFRILTAAEVTSPAVPVPAVLHEAEGNAVWVGTGGNGFARRVVKLGLQQNGLAQILAGLSPGDQVVTQGGVFLSNVQSAAR